MYAVLLGSNTLCLFETPSPCTKPLYRKIGCLMNQKGGGLPTKLHISSGVPPETAEECLVFHPRPDTSTDISAGVANTEDLCETHLPWRIAVKLDVRAEDNEEVRFARIGDARRSRGVVGPVVVGRVRVLEVGDGGGGTNFGVDQLGRYVAGAEFARLCHICEGAGQVDKGVAAIGGRKEEEIHFCAISFRRRTRISTRDMTIGLFGRDPW